MQKKLITKADRRERRRVRVRARVVGTDERPRLNVWRGLNSLYVQLIDDEHGKTLVGVHSSALPKKGDAGDRQGKVAVAYRLGKELAKKAKASNISAVVFDRAGYAYHGRVKALAEGARDGGLKF